MKKKMNIRFMIISAAAIIIRTGRKLSLPKNMEKRKKSAGHQHYLYILFIMQH